jgi:serine/threonine-protein kinase
MAPEQALGLPTDERADLYSLGCILFRVLSGTPPFQAPALLEVLRKQIEEKAPPVTSPHGPLPDILVGCVAKALAKRPEDRFRNAAEMRAVLDLAQLLLGGAEKAAGR